MVAWIQGHFDEEPLKVLSLQSDNHQWNILAGDGGGVKYDCPTMLKHTLNKFSRVPCLVLIATTRLLIQNWCLKRHGCNMNRLRRLWNKSKEKEKPTSLSVFMSLIVSTQPKTVTSKNGFVASGQILDTEIFIPVIIILTGSVCQQETSYGPPRCTVTAWRRRPTRPGPVWSSC